MREDDQFESQGDDAEKRDSFEFDDAGEEMDYISLDQAVLRARQMAQDDEERYRQRLNWDAIVWSEISSERREDTYRVLLQFRRPVADSAKSRPAKKSSSSL